MKEIKEHWYRYVFGLLIGLAGVLLVSFCTPKLLHPQIQETSCKGNCAKYLKISKDSLHELIAVFDNSVRDIKNIDEKINSINTRINDFYIFAGILITLLLVINVSVYIKTASEVHKHMDENFSEYSKKIAKHVQDAEDYVQTIKGTAELLQQQQKAASVNTQTTPPKTEK